MKRGSKRGAALVYVIVISAALLLLAAGLTTAAKYNVDASTNSLESRQAYFDAKSAIEFARAYLKSDPQSGSFSVLKTNTAVGFEARSGAVPGAVAQYNSVTKTINAAAKYKSSDRVRTLGYQLTAAEGSPAQAPGTFMAMGGYGSNDIADGGSGNYHLLFSGQQAQSAYPVFFHDVVHIDRTQSSLTAPAVYFLGTNGTNGSFYAEWNSGLTMHTPFIFIADKIVARGPAGNCLASVAETDPSVPRYLYFNRDCTVSVNNAPTATIPKGLYRFSGTANLFSLTDGNKGNYLISATAAEIQQYQFYIDTGIQVLGSVNKFYSSDSWSNYQGVQWAVKGLLSGESICSIDRGSGDLIWVFQNAYTGSVSGYEKIVNFYVSDCAGWGSNANVWYQGKTARYIAKQINLQYVNASTNFTVPSGKSVFFQADTILLNTQKTDTEVGTGEAKPKITHENAAAGGAANLILQSSRADSAFTLNVPSNLTVYYSDPLAAGSPVYNRTYSIKQGTYQISAHIGTQNGDFSGIGINLFSYAAEQYFSVDANRQPYTGGGTGGTGGGTTLSGGVYTDGR